MRKTNEEIYAKTCSDIKLTKVLVSELWKKYWDIRGDKTVEDLDKAQKREVNSLSKKITNWNYYLGGLRKNKKDLGEAILNSIEKGE